MQGKLDLEAQAEAQISACFGCRVAEVLDYHCRSSQPPNMRRIAHTGAARLLASHGSLPAALQRTLVAAQSDPSMAVRYSHLAPYVQRGTSTSFPHVPLYYEHICLCLSTQMDTSSFKDGSLILQADSNVAATV